MHAIPLGRGADSYIADIKGTRLEAGPRLWCLRSYDVRISWSVQEEPVRA